MNRIIHSRIFIVLLVTLTALPFLSLQQNKFDLEASITRGKEIYTAQCLSCHMENGEGLEGVFPPLAKSDYLMADQKRAVHQILNGLSGEITVNGKTYYGDMPAFDLTDEEVSDVLNYVQNSWGNKAKAVRPDDVKALRN